MKQTPVTGIDAKRHHAIRRREQLVGALPRVGLRRLKRCQCNNANPHLCSECEESTGVCYCKCHE